MRERHLMIVGGVLLGLLVLGGWILGRERPAATGAGEGEPELGHSEADERGSFEPGGIHPRAADPANRIAAEHMSDPSRRREFELEADRARDLMEVLKAGDEAWSPLLIDLDFSDTALETYARCSSRFLREPCPYTIEYVVEVTEPGHGEVVFGRMVMGQDDIEGCEEYARCVVQGNVGASVRVPSGIDGLLAHRKQQVDNYPDVTLEELEEMLKIVSGSVALMEERGPDGTPGWEYYLELERSYVLLIKMRIAALER